MQKLPLEGIRILDFCQIWAGAHVTQWLGVMGAEVIKVETRLRPDQTRRSFVPGKESMSVDMSAEFATLNYGKKSISLNMNQPKAVELAKQLVKLSDIVSDNFGGLIMERWGLGYADLKKLKPDIIVYSGSGYGRTGPYINSPAYAPIIDAFNGLTSVNGYLGGQPTTIGNGGWTDLLSAQYGVFAILAALYHRSKTGEGQYIDLAMNEAGFAILPEPVLEYTMNGRVLVPGGNQHETMAPHGCYRCRGEDKWVAIAVSNEEEWAAFCNALGNPEWTKRDEFSNEQSRWENQEELDKLITQWTIEHDHYEVMEILQKAGVMAGASLDLAEVANDPHLKKRDFIAEIEHPKMGKLRLLGVPWRLSGSPPGNYQHPPLLGEHNIYVFGELLGLSSEEIKQLEEEKVIY